MWLITGSNRAYVNRIQSHAGTFVFFYYYNVFTFVQTLYLQLYWRPIKKLSYKTTNPYNKVTGSCVPKDLANLWIDMVLLYSNASYRWNKNSNDDGGEDYLKNQAFGLSKFDIASARKVFIAFGMTLFLPRLKLFTFPTTKGCYARYETKKPGLISCFIFIKVQYLLFYENVQSLGEYFHDLLPLAVNIARLCQEKV